MALILWSKLENAGGVTSPQLGTGGVVVGAPTYPAARFNNGILSDANNEACYFPCAGAKNALKQFLTQIEQIRRH